MLTVAEQLRRAREAQNLDIHQISEITKIKTDHIRALESGNFEAFSALVYIRGFVRNYAKALKLNEAQVVTDLEAELNQTERFRELPPLTNQPQGALDYLMLQVSKLDWRVIVAVSLGLVVLISVFASVHHRHRNPEDPLRNLGPGLYAPSGGVSGDTLPLPPIAPAKP